MLNGDAPVPDVRSGFYCEDCQHGWSYDPEADKLYQEYLKLKPLTTNEAKIGTKSGVYEVRYIDQALLSKKKDIARKLINYKHTLDVSAAGWYELEMDSH